MHRITTPASPKRRRRTEDNSESGTRSAVLLGSVINVTGGGGHVPNIQLDVKTTCLRFMESESLEVSLL